MLLYTLTKKIIEIQGNMLNAFGIIMFYKMVCWFDNQDITMESRRLKFNPLFQHILLKYVHACKCIILKWVMDR